MKFYLKIFTYLFSTLLFISSCKEEKEKKEVKKRPNFLFVLVDDQSPFDLQTYDPKSILETPNISRLASEGMVFESARPMGSMNGAVCTPSRHMIMTGRTLWHLPPSAEFQQNTAPNSLDEQTIGAIFNRAGYETMRTCKKGNSYPGANKQFKVIKDATKRGGTEETGSAWHAKQVIDYLSDRESKTESDPFFIYFGFSHPHDIRDGTPELLREKESSKQERIAELLKNGYPAYTTSAGWLGYSDEKMKRLCSEAKEAGFDHMKIKVGSDLQDDMRRAAIIREEIGPDLRLMMDANQKWDVEEAIINMAELKKFDPYWIEEPTSPDDILGHARIAKAVAPIKVATGEHCQNRVMFKQLMQADAIGICQIDSCRVGGVNEILAILLMAAKFKIPVCPHAGGVGLCEYVQHLSMIDYIAISGSLENRIIEYVDHLHEHFFDPVVIKNGAYMPPNMAGYSITMKPESIEEYSFPNGSFWKEELNMNKLTENEV